MSSDVSQSRKMARRAIEAYADLDKLTREEIEEDKNLRTLTDPQKAALIKMLDDGIVSEGETSGMSQLNFSDEFVSALNDAVGSDGKRPLMQRIEWLTKNFHNPERFWGLFGYPLEQRIQMIYALAEYGQEASGARERLEGADYIGADYRYRYAARYAKLKVEGHGVDSLINIATSDDSMLMRSAAIRILGEKASSGRDPESEKAAGQILTGLRTTTDVREVRAYIEAGYNLAVARSEHKGDVIHEFTLLKITGQQILSQSPTDIDVGGIIKLLEEKLRQLAGSSSGD